MSSEAFTSVTDYFLNEARNHSISSHKLTTGYTFEGYTIEKYFGIASGHVVLGTGFLSEFTANFANFLGVESTQFAKKMETAKEPALRKLIETSITKGGNALIGVDFDYINLKSNLIGVSANGTSVTIKKNET